jgi:hypothetical protein
MELLPYSGILETADVVVAGVNQVGRPAGLHLDERLFLGGDMADFRHAAVLVDVGFHQIRRVVA